MPTRRSVDPVRVANKAGRRTAAANHSTSVPLEKTLGPNAPAPGAGRSAVPHEDDRLSCSFTFADGRRCRLARSSVHPDLCYFHARKEAQTRAAEEIGRDISYFFSAPYLSANDLNAALGHLFSAVVQGHIKTKTAGTLAYLAQTLLQSIQLAESEYIEAFGTDSWRDVVFSSVNDNSDYSRALPDPSADSASDDSEPDDSEPASSESNDDHLSGDPTTDEENCSSPLQG